MLSRRSLISAGLLLTAAGLAGCSKAVRTALTATSTPPGTTSSTSIPASSRTAGPDLPGSAPAPSNPGLESVTASSPTVPAATGSPGSAVEIVNGPRDQPRVALTFHGAGDIGLARQLLRIANARGVRLTVMAVGTWLADNPTIATEILAGGHQL